MSTSAAIKRNKGNENICRSQKLTSVTKHNEKDEVTRRDFFNNPQRVGLSFNSSRVADIKVRRTGLLTYSRKAPQFTQSKFNFF